MSKSTPKAPDYAAAAREQAASSKEVTTDQTWANRANQYTPWGSQTWEARQDVDPATGKPVTRWDQTTNLNPDAKATLDAQLQYDRDKANLGASMTGRLNESYKDPMDFSNLPAMGEGVEAGKLDSSEKYRQDSQDAIYNQWASRALPNQKRDLEGLQERLYGMGLKEGDPQFDRQMDRLRESQSDAMQQATYQATIGSGAEASRSLGMDATAGGQNFAQGMQSSQYQNQLRQQKMAEEMQKRGFNLNEINAIMSGGQVQMPNMPQYNTASRSEGTQNLAAAQMQGQAALDAYNAKQAAIQGTMSGVGSMAGGFAGFSDRRLKKDIVKIGESNGINIYEWTYLWGEKSRGVMADEVPWAVAGHVAGFAVVDYGRVW